MLPYFTGFYMKWMFPEIIEGKHLIHEKNVEPEYVINAHTEVELHYKTFFCKGCIY